MIDMDVRASREHELETESELDETYDEKYIDQQLNATVLDDFKQALYEVRYIAPILALLGIILAYHLTIAPYRTKVLDDKGFQNVNDLVRCLVISHRERKNQSHDPFALIAGAENS